MQLILKTKPEGMLSYLEYLMHVTHSLVLNRHLNTVLYVVALPLSHTAPPAPSVHSLLLCGEDAEQLARGGPLASARPVGDHPLGRESEVRERSDGES